MFAGVRDNPLLFRLLDKRTRPSLASACGLALAAGVTSVALVAWERTAHRFVSATLLEWSALFSVIGLSVIASVGASVFAVMLARRDMQTGEYDLLRATMVSEEKIVASYFVAALYRERFLLALLAGLDCGFLLLVADTLWKFLLFLYLMLPVVINSWGLVLFGAALGVNLALRNDMLWRPLIFAPLVTLLGGFILLSGMAVASFLSCGAAPYLLMPLLFGLANNIRDDARHWARPRR